MSDNNNHKTTSRHNGDRGAKVALVEAVSAVDLGDAGEVRVKCRREGGHLIVEIEEARVDHDVEPITQRR